MATNDPQRDVGQRNAARTRSTVRLLKTTDGRKGRLYKLFQGVGPGEL